MFIRSRQLEFGHHESLVGEANTSGLALLFSLKHDFPSEWHKLATPGSEEDF